MKFSSFLTSSSLNLLAILLLGGGGKPIKAHPSHHHHDRMSRHLVLQNVANTDVIMIAEAETTEGPFDEEESDYMDSTDMTLAATAGSSGGIIEDRLSVLNGVPLDLTLTLYSVDTIADTAQEIDGAEVFVWHCDASGSYSAVADRMQAEDTEGQKWLRSKGTTGTDGTITFQTILPGWYSGRAVHYHFRIRLPGETTYAATSQMFISDSDLARYEDIAPYSDSTGRITSLATDNIYREVAATVGDALTLNLDGTIDAGFTSSLKIGLTTSDYVASDEEGTTKSSGNIRTSTGSSTALTSDQAGEETIVNGLASGSVGGYEKNLRQTLIVTAVCAAVYNAAANLF